MSVYINNIGYVHYDNDRCNNSTVIFKDQDEFLDSPLSYFVDDVSIYNHQIIKSYNYNTNNIKPEEASKNLNLRYMICITLTIDQLSMLQSSRTLPLFMDTLATAFNNSDDNLFKSEYQWLCIIEYAPLRGYDAHILFINNVKFTKTCLQELESKIHKLIQLVKLNINNKITNCSPVVKSMFIKRNGSYLNYLKKDIKGLISNKMDLLSTFLNFERTHIFATSSVPKRYKRASNGTIINSEHSV